MPPSIARAQGSIAAIVHRAHSDIMPTMHHRYGTERERKVPGRLNQQKKTKEPKKENKDIVDKSVGGTQLHVPHARQKESSSYLISFLFFPSSLPPPFFFFFLNSAL